MALKGIGNKPVAYIPECERDNDVDPTVFWLKPKNTEQTYRSLSRYTEATDQLRGGKQKVNPMKMLEGDRADFLAFCKKVENYQFSEELYPEHYKKGVIAEVDNEEMLDDLFKDLDPLVFQEIQDVVSNWTMLKQGEKKSLK